MNGRIEWPLPQPQPVTALRGGPVALTFEDYVKARLVRRLENMGHACPGIVDEAVQRLYDTHGAYAVKPKRGSRGVVWNNRVFWWSAKGYYRPGKGAGPRRPLQHYIWEAHHGRAMRRLDEIFFRDRDRHNFSIENLELLTKAQLHARTHALGETRSLTFDERSQIRGRWATKKSRDLTALLLGRAQTNKRKDNQNGHLITTLHARKVQD